jgi:hypothetical protein
LACLSCGALSVPRKNRLLPLVTAATNALPTVPSQDNQLGTACKGSSSSKEWVIISHMQVPKFVRHAVRMQRLYLTQEFDGTHKTVHKADMVTHGESRASAPEGSNCGAEVLPETVHSYSSKDAVE